MGWAPGPLGDVQAADREIARQTARRARAVADFAAARPASADRAPGEPGCMSADRRGSRPASLAGVSEWAAQELAIALSITTPAAVAENVDTAPRLADQPRQDTGPSRNVTRPGESAQSELDR